MRDFQKNRRWVYGFVVLPMLIFTSAQCSRDQNNQPPHQKNNQDAEQDQTRRVEAERVQPEQIKPEQIQSELRGVGVTVPVPDWAADAIWYSIDVDRFHNGDRTNDPDDTLAWTTDRLVELNGIQNMEERIFGGDIQGLKQRLPYLKTLGVNTLLLSPVFQGPSIHPERNSLHHIDNRYGKRSNNPSLKNEADDPATWSFTESDRIFIDFLKEAHRMGFRVVAGINLFMIEGEQDNISPERQKSILTATHRWMDPNGDGDPSDGVDGWQVNSEFANIKFINQWYKHVVKLNRDALLFGHGGAEIIWDARVQYFFNIVNKSDIHKLKDLFAIQQNTQPLSEKLVHLRRIGQPMIPQLMLASPGRLDGAIHGFSFRPTPEYPSEKLVKICSQWKLTVIFQYFDFGTPFIDYGNEVGIISGREPKLYPYPPMWWPDLPDPKTKSPDYRGDFFALIQWLNETRTRYAPLRRGNFREVLHDEENHILAFARTYQNEEVILVMNYGSTKQKVMLPASKPGQIVVTLSPHLTPRSARGAKKTDYTKIRRLHVGAARQFVNKEGKIRMWIDPMSVRVVLVSDK